MENHPRPNLVTSIANKLKPKPPPRQSLAGLPSSIDPVLAGDSIGLQGGPPTPNISLDTAHKPPDQNAPPAANKSAEQATAPEAEKPSLIDQARNLFQVAIDRDEKPNSEGPFTQYGEPAIHAKALKAMEGHADGGDAQVAYDASREQTIIHNNNVIEQMKFIKGDLTNANEQGIITRQATDKDGKPALNDDGSPKMEEISINQQLIKLLNELGVEGQALAKTIQDSLRMKTGENKIAYREVYRKEAFEQDATNKQKSYQQLEDEADAKFDREARIKVESKNKDLPEAQSQSYDSTEYRKAHEETAQVVDQLLRTLTEEAVDKKDHKDKNATRGRLSQLLDAYHTTTLPDVKMRLAAIIYKTAATLDIDPSQHPELRKAFNKLFEHRNKYAQILKESEDVLLREAGIEPDPTKILTTNSFTSLALAAECEQEGVIVTNDGEVRLPNHVDEVVSALQRAGKLNEYDFQIICRLAKRKGSKAPSRAQSLLQTMYGVDMDLLKSPARSQIVAARTAKRWITDEQINSLTDKKEQGRLNQRRMLLANQVGRDVLETEEEKKKKKNQLGGFLTLAMIFGPQVLSLLEIGVDMGPPQQGGRPH